MLARHRTVLLRVLATFALLVLVAVGATGVVHGAAGGSIQTVAGSGSGGFGGDGGPATSALLTSPSDVVPLDSGGYLIADTSNHRIRRIDATGVMTTVAGAGPAVGAPGAFAGDGLAATDPAVRLNQPRGVSPLNGGGFLIADTGNNRIRRVDVDGTIRTVAGAGPAGFGGDGGPAGKALLNGPEGVTALADGSLAIADSTNERLRLVGTDGTISTLAGTGTIGFSGDGGDPALAQLSHPRAVAQDGTRLLLADSFNHRIRSVVQGPPPVDNSLDTTPPLGVSPPVLGKSVVAKPRAGKVLVRLAGTRRFVPLESISNLPMGSELDAADGSVAVFFATTPTGKRAKGIATGGRFVVDQPTAYDLGQRPGEMTLSGPMFGCSASPQAQVRDGAQDARAASAAVRARAAGHAKHGRRLKVRARGRIRTRGRYGAATVRGTQWTIVDRCASHPRPGTLVVVSKGLVTVRSFVLRKTVFVPAGARFLAPARRR